MELKLASPKPDPLVPVPSQKPLQNPRLIRLHCLPFRGTRMDLELKLFNSKNFGVGEGEEVGEETIPLQNP